ncbi:MAG: ATPase [Deltaproteobacteria bacterium]|nr:ATPase [Deltaproteobacteria bacterium]
MNLKTLMQKFIVGTITFLSLLAIFQKPAFCSGGGISVLPDASVLIQVINFILLILLLNIVMFKPIRNIISKRKERIDGFSNDIKSLISSVKEKEKAFDQKIKEARAKGLKEKEVMITEAENQERKILVEINKKAGADMEAIKEKIKKDADAVRKSLQDEINNFAAFISKKILGREA